MSQYMPFEKPDGSCLLRGDWIEIDLPSTGRGVGKFSGAYNNPRYGLMAYLSHFRTFDDPSQPKELYFALRAGPTLDALNSATRADGPIHKARRKA